VSLDFPGGKESGTSIKVMFKQKSNLPENLLPEILLLPFLSLFQPLFLQNSSIFRLNFVN